MEYTVTFFTHSGAVKFENFMKQKCIKAVLMPVPRKLSSSCGIAARIDYNGDIKEIIIEDIDKVYVTNSQGVKLIYTHP